MKIHIISIFPESLHSYIDSSMLKKARNMGKVQIFYYDLKKFAKNPTGRVDEKAYGMHGQVIGPEPLGGAIESIFENIGKKIPVVYMSPSGELLIQEKVEKYSEKLGEFIIICGHYEGIDQRIIDIYVDYEISIGDYVITSGELASMVFIDSIIRHIPGVIGNSESLEEESFSQKLSRQKEYPVYTRPENYKGVKVPSILLSGNHKEIEVWKKNNLKK